MPNPPGVALRPFTRDEFDAASALAELAFLMPTPSAEERARFAVGVEFDRSLAAFDRERMVGTAGAYTFLLTVPGAAVPAAGVTVVTVHPAWRRRGVATAMMHRQLSDLREGGEAVAVLRASEASIYGRFGYACATRELSIELGRSPSTLVATAPGPGAATLELAEPAAVRDRLVEVYDALRPHSPGFVGRPDAGWTEVLHDPEHRRGGATGKRALLVRDGAATRGYALYRVQENWTEGLPAGRVMVEELLATDPAAAVALWRHLLDVDLTASVQAWARPLDDPLLELLVDPRRARPRFKDGLWLRLVRLGEALAARRYAAPVDLVMEITDAACPWNAGRWRLSGNEHGADCAASTDPADLQLDVTTLAAGYLGDPVLGAHLAAGRITQHTPGSARRLATALGWSPGPWCPHHF